MRSKIVWFFVRCAVMFPIFIIGVDGYQNNVWKWLLLILATVILYLVAYVEGLKS